MLGAHHGVKTGNIGSMNYDYHVFKLPLKAQTPQTLYRHLKGDNVTVGQFTLWKPNNFIKYNNSNHLYFGFYFGALLIMVGYNFILFHYAG